MTYFMIDQKEKPRAFKRPMTSKFNPDTTAATGAVILLLLLLIGGAL